MAKVVIEICNGVVHAAFSDHPVEIHIIDFDTQGMNKETLTEYAEEILIPMSILGRNDISEVLEQAKAALLKEAEEL